MKFAKELDHDLVPEWRVKYLDYKLGKKKLKAIENAAIRYNNSNRKGSISSGIAGRIRYSNDNDDRPRRSLSTNAPAENRHDHTKSHDFQPTTPRIVPEARPPATKRDRHARMTRYGSIIGSPPNAEDEASRSRVHRGSPEPRESLESRESIPLPSPALDPDATPTPSRAGTIPRTSESIRAVSCSSPKHGPRPGNAARSVSMADGRAHAAAPSPRPKRGLRPLAQRIMSLRPRRATLDSSGNNLDMFRDVDARTSEFFFFLDSELEKIESFYRQKEAEATRRLAVLREQLHIMRDQRVAEIVAFREAKRQRRSLLESATPHENDPLLLKRAKIKTKELLRPVDNAWDKAQLGRVGKTFKAMNILGTPTGPVGQDHPDMGSRDYAPRPLQYDVQYRAAKHKLKTAMAEYYRGLELLKSYAMVNRTAFRKINKKYDKTVNARPPGRYMIEKVNKAAFVNNDLLDSHIYTVEDLYARYFEKGDRKTAVGKLRVKAARAGEYSSNSFRSGIMLATGLVFGVEGLVKALGMLSNPDPTFVTRAIYLLQIYGGYFLMLALALMFCFACRIWQHSRVNYQFIFEFDSRHTLDWKQLSEIPCALSLLLGLFMWINFSQYGGQTMYLYWPVVLIGLSTLLIFLPYPIFYHRSRSWLATSLWRLSLAGLYPVEFRDFFLGDLFCSQTYAVGNLVLFSCLYAQGPIWSNPSQCNSSHSRLLGFLTTLPGIWRALQCLRRYYDTRNVFPHLVNCGKYLFTILYYMSLSLYRITPHSSLMAMFITFATINAVYTSAWDIVMDWSLLDPHAPKKFLRSTLAYEKAWPYYAAIVIDPIIRFNWILYAVYTHDLQHSTKIAFIVALTEVFRRGVWVVFRVENEHCTNVGRFRASRDVPLPYDVDSTSSISDEQQKEDETLRSSEGNLQGSSDQAAEAGPQLSQATGADLERAQSQAAPSLTDGSTLRQRKGLQSFPQVVSTFRRMGTILRAAHAQDFERKRKPEVTKGHHPIDYEDEDDEDEIEEASRAADIAVESDEDMDLGQNLSRAEHSLRAAGNDHSEAVAGAGAGPMREIDDNIATIDQVGRDDRALS